MRAALTGHVIFSTLHAPSAVEAVIRLTDMGVAPYLAADALAGVVSQRLVRCRRSDGSYQGRFCLCEVVHSGAALRQAVQKRSERKKLLEAASQDQAVFMKECISHALREGLTDKPEIRRVYDEGEDDDY